MNGINKLLNELKQDYMMYVEIAYADQLARAGGTGRIDPRAFLRKGVGIFACPKI